jgi:hypothetical protein
VGKWDFAAILLSENKTNAQFCAKYYKHFTSLSYSLKKNELPFFHNNGTAQFKKRKQWKGINHKQSTRWQHLSRLKARAFFSMQFFQFL